MVKNENQSVFENFFAIEIGGLLFAFLNILWKIRLEIREAAIGYTSKKGKNI